MFGIAASQQVISIELSLTEDSEQEAKILCSESSSREVQEMPNCGVSSVAFSNRQVLNRLVLKLILPQAKTWSKIPCSESGPRELQEMQNGGISSVAFSNRQVLNFLGLQSPWTLSSATLMAATSTSIRIRRYRTMRNRLQIISSKKQQICRKWQQIGCK